jgi:hypothetical protein
MLRVPGAAMALTIAIAVAADAVRPDAGAPFFSHASDRLEGERADVALDVSVTGECGETVSAFDRAELVVTRSRFATVTIVQQPPSGCVNCDALRVRWQHEPTGYLAFEVYVYRRPVRLSC